MSLYIDRPFSPPKITRGREDLRELYSRAGPVGSVSATGQSRVGLFKGSLARSEELARLARPHRGTNQTCGPFERLRSGGLCRRRVAGRAAS